MHSMNKIFILILLLSSAPAASGGLYSKLICAGVGLGVGTAVTFFGVPAAAGVLGFTANGITQGSVAAAMMSAAAKMGTGMTVVSSLQSTGAAGIGVGNAAAFSSWLLAVCA